MPRTTYDPASELVDVIDDEGRTIGVVPRREMRGKRLAHRCVYVLVFNAKGELFIHLRTPTKDVYPSHWDTNVGGVLAAGETFDVGVRREIEEEIGVMELSTLKELFPFRYADDRSVVQAMAYLLIHEGPFRLQPEEIVRGEFVLLEEVWRRAAATPFCPDGLQLLREAQTLGIIPLSAEISRLDSNPRR